MIHARTGRLASGVIAAGAVLIAAIIAADVHDAWLDYRSALAANARFQDALGSVLADHTARLVQETDIVLSEYGQWSVSVEGRAADASLLRDRLRTAILRLPFVYSAMLLEPDGTVAATSRAAGVAPDARAVGSGARVLVPQSALSDALYIGPPFVAAAPGTGTFSISRRLAASDDAQARLVVAQLAFEDFTGFDASIEAAPDLSIRLLRRDGAVLAQFRGRARARDAATGASPARDTVAALRAVEGYPLDVEVSRPLSSVLQPWRDQEVGAAVRTLLLVLLAVALLLALRSALLRQARRDQELRRLEHEMEAARRLDALGFLAASVAHDFNNVLSAIVGYGELTRASLADRPGDVANVDRLLAAAERARLLVRRVLTFDPRRGVDYSAVPLNPILEELTQQIRAWAPRSVTLQSSGLATPAVVLGDATEIFQVVMNVCSNAVHAMAHGGTLQIELSRVEQQDERRLTLGELTRGSWVRVAIIDSGTGLSAAQIESIFEPFYSTGGAGHGTGIGLTVVRNILTRMQGALEVRSELAAGTRVDIYWPAAPTDAARDDAPDFSTRSGHGETVLVVDDDPELVRLTEDLLASLGYEPVGFTGARAALAAFDARPQRYDALVTDERMDEMDGCVLAAQLHERHPQFPVVIVTGYRNADLLLRARAAGVAEILDKPLAAGLLAAALARQLARSGPRQ